MLLIQKRRRGTAVVDTPKGVLVVSEDGKTYYLPGGGAEDRESRRNATLRELEEETGLKFYDCSYLFDCNGSIRQDKKGGFVRDYHKVYLVKALGVAEPRSEIKHIAYAKGSNLSLSFTTKRIIDKYLGLKIRA